MRTGQKLDIAKRLRGSQTEAEQKLWSLLRAKRLLGYKFKRQSPIGPYIVDFCCHAHRLVVEVDGGHHSILQPEDKRRAQFLKAQGFYLLRFWNNDVLKQPEVVLQQILETLTPPPPSLSRLRERVSRRGGRGVK